MENLQVPMEVTFNLLYLFAVWAIVIIMVKRKESVPKHETGPALWILIAFALLALGDTGHVGFRVVAFALGGLDTSFTIGGKSWNLAGLGSMATSWTFTAFYVCMVFMWRSRFSEKLGVLAWFLLLLAVFRSIVMLLPGNQWDQLMSPRPISIIRSTPLLLMQVGVAYLILRDATRSNDGTFRWIGLMILVSFVFYAPVVFLVHSIPPIGMLMIPKTLAYLVIAVIGLKHFYMSTKVTAVPA